MAINKKAVKAEFEALGQWKQFIHYREYLVACGIDRLEAWEQTADVAHRLVERFGAEEAGRSLVAMVRGEECPLDTVPEELPEAPAEVVEAPQAAPPAPLAEPVTFKGVPIEMEPFLPATEPAIRALIAEHSIPTKERIIGPDPTAWVEVKGPALHPALPPALTTPRGPRPPVYSKAVVPQGLSENVDRKRFYKPQASPREAVEWVAGNISVADVMPEDCPGPEAWGLLCWARKNEGNLNTFWTSHYPKLMPSKSENENAGRRRDNVDAINELIGAVEDAGRAAVENCN